MTGFCTNYGPWNRGHGPERGFPRQTPPHLSRLISEFDNLAGASWSELVGKFPQTAWFLSREALYGKEKGDDLWGLCKFV